MLRFWMRQVLVAEFLMILGNGGLAGC